jgi:uncharacterized protein (TIGR02996 family)
MDVEASLSQAIHDDPSDETNWLVLADWLEEQGDRRAELLRLTLALRARPAGPEAPAQEVRLQELLASGVRPWAPLRTNSIGMQFALIRPGTFLMGSPDSEAERYSDEGPVHEVEITSPFYLGVHPVTQAQFKKVMGKGPSHFSGNPQHPVEQVSWDDAVELCQRLSDMAEEKRRKRLYRLPTEAEWEHACRAGTTTPFAFGDSLSSAQANFDGARPYGAAPAGPFRQMTTKVGSFAPNAWGLFDLHGNVWEWCADWYDENYYQQSPRQNPQGPQNGQSRVLRGGSWYSGGRNCRAARRLMRAPGYRYYFLGFRVVLLSA